LGSALNLLNRQQSAGGKGISSGNNITSLHCQKLRNFKAKFKTLAIQQQFLLPLWKGAKPCFFLLLGAKGSQTWCFRLFLLSLLFFQQLALPAT
jgi:hypothetical protein